MGKTKTLIAKVDIDFHKQIKTKSVLDGIDIQDAIRFFMKKWANGELEVGTLEEVKDKPQSAQ